MLNPLAVLMDAVDRHGGGIAGLASVVRRGVKVIRALGVRGFWTRIEAARRPVPGSAPPASAFDFPPPAPVGAIALRVAVMAHVFYTDLVDELVAHLGNIPMPFVLLVSVVDADAKLLVESRCAHLRLVSLDVRIVPNRGRDIAPLLVTFREEILAVDMLCHVHTKKSLYTGSEKTGWRQYLMHSLLGSRERVAWILGMFQATPELGTIHPENFSSVPLAAHTWLSNLDQARELGTRLGIAIRQDEYLDFAAGSMFWIRVEAIRPLYELGLKTSDFPEEQAQIDGTLQHAVERMIVQVVRQRGMLAGILPADGELRLGTEGGRNWKAHFTSAFRDKFRLHALDARVVSFDVFDTLVLRAFLHPGGARDYLSEVVERRLGLRGFTRLREKAESTVRAAAGRDVDTHAIYGALAAMPEARGHDVEAIHRLEIETEQRLLTPRAAVADCAADIAAGGATVVAVSDMYLDAASMRGVLPGAITRALARIHVSCETGMRKDSGEAWAALPVVEGCMASEWLHVGDNEHADIQLPHGLGFIPPVHVLRPSALLEVVPALRPLRPALVASTRWEDQLWLGLVANRLTQLADTQPAAFDDALRLDDPALLGYVVLGPLLLDYLLWLAREARRQQAGKIVFLSREGYFLQRAYRALQRAAPSLAPIAGVYLLASRRGLGVPSLRRADDLHHLLASTFTGRLGDLVEARMGTAILAVVTAVLGRSAMAREVYLPEMRDAIVGMLAPAMDGILDIAAIERSAYLRYLATESVDADTIAADLGYAGTIQGHLARLTGHDLGGAYFAIAPGPGQPAGGCGRMCARFHDARHGDARHSAVVDHHLLLESLFTAPHAQFSHFREVSGDLQPVFVGPSIPRASFASLHEVHRGAEDFIAAVAVVVGPDLLDVAFDRGHVQVPLQCWGTGLWRAGRWAHGLGVDDPFTGRGSVRMPDERAAGGCRGDGAGSGGLARG